MIDPAIPKTGFDCVHNVAWKDRELSQDSRYGTAGPVIVCDEISIKQHLNAYVCARS
jgi:hypothetical protein